MQFIITYVDNNKNMSAKAWLMTVRVLNIICVALMIGFEMWFLIDLFISGQPFVTIIIRLFVPIFVVLLAIIILAGQFKFSKVVENFRFLQHVAGLALFYVFIASIFAFEFSTVTTYGFAYMTAGIFLGLALIMGILACLRPQGTDGLLTN